MSASSRLQHQYNALMRTLMQLPQSCCFLYTWNSVNTSGNFVCIHLTRDVCSLFQLSTQLNSLNTVFMNSIDCTILLRYKLNLSWNHVLWSSIPRKINNYLILNLNLGSEDCIVLILSFFILFWQVHDPNWVTTYSTVGWNVEFFFDRTEQVK